MAKPDIFRAVESRAAEAWRDGVRESVIREIPDEAPVGLLYDSRPYVVLMATPSDVEDLAVGFTVTERIARFQDVAAISVSAAEEGLLADLLLSPAAGDALSAARRRTLEARSSCGLCGVESLAEAVRPMPPVTGGPSVTRAAIGAALEGLEAGQSMGRITRATHAAAWFEPSGAEGLVREDVGRHNALDKLIGALLRSGRDPASGFVVVTSRCSYEMVEKAAAAGVAVLVAMSAPTALAIRKAEAAGMTLVALARADGHTVFTRTDRIAER